MLFQTCSFVFWWQVPFRTGFVAWPGPRLDVFTRFVFISRTSSHFNPQIELRETLGLDFWVYIINSLIVEGLLQFVPFLRPKGDHVLIFSCRRLLVRQDFSNRMFQVSTIKNLTRLSKFDLPTIHNLKRKENGSATPKLRQDQVPWFPCWPCVHWASPTGTSGQLLNIIPFFCPTF